MDRNAKLETLFESLIELPSEERAARLDEQCRNDHQLRHELEELLRHHDADTEEPDFLGSLTGGSAPLTSPVGKTVVHDSNARGDQIGPYRILERLGTGGMGAVYRVEHVRLRKQFALKQLSCDAGSRHDLVARFEREMESVGKLDHENLVGASDAGDVDGLQYLVMDLIDGVTLAELQRRNNVLPVAEACEIARQAASGLAHAHDAGIVHRDIKPSNLMVTQDGCVKIVDFGLTLLSDSINSDLTKAGSVMGTVDFMSPEQATGDLELDHRTDLYSLGATLYKLLTGFAPLESSEPELLTQKLTKLATVSAPRIETRRHDLPPGLGDLVDRMLSRNPALRPTSAAEVERGLAEYSAGADLVGLVAGESSAATAPVQPLDPSHARRTRPKPKTLIGVVLAAGLLLFGYLAFWSTTGPESEPSDWELAGRWTPKFQRSPATRSVAAWPYVFVVTDKPVEEMGATLDQLYALCEQEQLTVADSAVTLAFLDGAMSPEQDGMVTTATEIRIRLYDDPPLSRKELRQVGESLGLRGVGFRHANPGEEAFITKPRGVDDDASWDLWYELIEFVDSEHSPGAYTAPMERIGLDLWDQDLDYASVETELIVPLE